MSSIVFVVQEVRGKNLTPAKEFGTLQLLLSRDQIHLDPKPAINSLHEGLQNFTDEDYLLLIGDPIAIGISVQVAASYNFGRVKVLKWDKEQSNYNDIQLELYDDADWVSFR